MKKILAPKEMDPAIKWECDCGYQFWTDPCDYQNLVIIRAKALYLYPECPKCGKIETEERILDEVIDRLQNF